MIRQVFLIAHPALFDDHLYHVSNIEWSFEITEARFFKTREDAQIHLSRLQDPCQCRKEVWLQGLEPDSLFIKESEQEVQEYFWITI